MNFLNWLSLIVGLGIIVRSDQRLFRLQARDPHLATISGKFLGNTLLLQEPIANHSA